MAQPTSSPILRVIRRVVDDRRATGLSDRELLHRFFAQQDETAFRALLRRHGPMVLGVCRSLLRHEPDAEDAFQATFLVFARKARDLREAASLGSWLYGVAYRTALKARAESVERTRHEARVRGRPAAAAADDLSWREVQEVLHGELNGLPQSYRAPLVLCYLQGLTQDEAAAQLRLPKGTLKGRLERGRALLRDRLARRGLGPAGLLVASAWPAAPGPAAALPPPLALATARSTTAVVAGAAPAGSVSPQVATLSRGVLKAMFVTKLKIAAAAALALAFVGGVGSLAVPTAASGEGSANGTASASRARTGTDARGDEAAGGDNEEVAKLKEEVAKLKEQVARLKAINALQAAYSSLGDLDPERSRGLLADAPEKAPQPKPAVEIPNAWLQGIDRERPTLSVALGAKPLDGERFQVLIGADELDRLVAGNRKAGGWVGVGLFVRTADGKLAVLPVRGARLENLPLAKDAKVTVGGKEANLGDLKEQSVITLELAPDGDRLVVRGVRAAK